MLTRLANKKNKVTLTCNKKLEMEPLPCSLKVS